VRPAAALLFGLGAVVIGHWAIAGLDRGRFHWSDAVPVSLRLVALILMAATMGFGTWALHKYGVPSSDHVITSGPYALVRHPLSLAVLVISLASGVALGSWLAAAWSALFVPLIVWAIAKEDRSLITEIPAYDAYARHVRYRLFPGVW
jgi:protein-S-isoprenylcysteine O-methyltransferase Ste14